MGQHLGFHSIVCTACCCSGAMFKGQGDKLNLDSSVGCRIRFDEQGSSVSSRIECDERCNSQVLHTCV